MTPQRWALWILALTLLVFLLALFCTALLDPHTAATGPAETFPPALPLDSK